MWSEDDLARSFRLREIPRVRQHDGESRRRWFTCDSTDLYVWEDKTGVLLSFELCYDKPHAEQVLRYRSGAGFDHSRIDDGESSPLKNQTPIIMPSGQVDLMQIALKFEPVAVGIDSQVYRFVLGKLHGDR
jgi:hypothetical protein